MDIYAKKGDKVIITEDSATNGTKSDKEVLFEHLVIGKIYTVEYTDVHGWYTDVYLQEVPDINFNSVNFEDVLPLKESI